MSARIHKIMRINIVEILLIPCRYKSLKKEKRFKIQSKSNKVQYIMSNF